jgi:hypothetical protein
VDIFSCEPFDQQTVVQFAMTKFQSRDVEVRMVERATRSPRRSERDRVRRETSLAERWHSEWPGFKDVSEIPDIVF